MDLVVKLDFIVDLVATYDPSQRWNCRNAGLVRMWISSQRWTRRNVDLFTLQRGLVVIRQDRLPELASHVRRCERAIADAQMELFRLKDAKANPSSATPIVGTGPGGAVTESDRLKARAKAMMQQRSTALAGKKVEVTDDGSGAAQRQEEESKRVTREREDNEKMVKDVEDSVTEYSKSLEQGLKEGGESKADEHERPSGHRRSP